MKIKLFFSAFLFTAIQLFSQPGKLGNLTVNANMILNSYSPVTSNIISGTNSVTVLAQSSLLNLCPGDLIMIYEAQGAAVATNNSVLFGSLISYNNAGIYEFAYVKSVSGNTITTSSVLGNSYTTLGMTQVIKVPQYINLTINTGSQVQARKWKDTTISSVVYRFGGVLAIHATNITNNGTITANGSGFRGGFLDSTNAGFYTQNVSAYLSNNKAQGGEKGEGIAGFSYEYNSLGARYCRGAIANGGGGGNGWNSGGGGGANANNGNTWSGQGVMQSTVTGASAWSLDPGYIANGNALTNSSGGGRGGYSVGFSALNPTIVGPNNSSWGADGRKEVGGLGGRPLTNINYSNRIYFGGGGGAGDQNDACGSKAGNGGGIVYLVATNNVSGNGIISADGENGGNTINSGVDAPSGAGAGGSVIILSAFISNTQQISAKGGAGGNQFITASEFEGPGGGGGGGYVGVTSSGLIIDVSGGNNGTTNSSLMTAFPSNGATAGANGQSSEVAYTFINYNPSLILNATSNSPVCVGDMLSLSTSSLGSAVYSWAGPNGFSSIQQNPTISNAPLAASGVYSLSCAVAGCSSLTTTLNIIVNPLPAVSVSGSSIICNGQTATLTAGGASTYTWSTGSTLNSIFVNPVVSTNYTVTGMSSAGCVSSTTVQLFVDDCLSIKEQNNLSYNFEIYPNPGNGEFKIITNYNMEFTIDLYNSVGQLIYKNAPITNNQTLNLSNQSDGLYYFVLSTKDFNLYKKVVLKR